MSRGLPSGTVTFLFTDVEGSTRLLHEVGAQEYARALDEHRRIVRAAIAKHGGIEVDTQGDAFFVAFADAREAVFAAREAQERLASGPISVRIGLHTGAPHVTHEGYVGEDVHLGARVAAAGHGGQVLLSATTRALVDGEVTDLGEHRLKDFAEPVAIFQLGDDRFPPLKTVSNTNLPRPASSFVGRDREVAEITAALREGARLLTLTGPGGTGKTRLAIEAAAELVPEFKAGVFWVGLAPLREPALVLEEIAQTLGAKDGLAAHVGDREMLLLLDNFEQVVGAAPELAQLAESCANLKLLVTSRELLRVRGEVDYPVLPLADPEAVALFCARARTDADDDVLKLCRALDNLPLALELAAARTSVLTPKQIVERLSKRLDLLKGGRDADPRQQTLRATIEWSYELLNAQEKRLFERLSVFVGGCTLDAGERVVEADLDVLQSLVEKSLVRRTGDRFWMLETIREYANERLEAGEEGAAIRRRHTEYFVGLVTEAEPHLSPHPSREWVDRLESENDNIRAVFEELERAGETQPLLELAGALKEFWALRGLLGEGRRRVEDALAADERPTPARAKALATAADMAMAQADEAGVRLRAGQALELYRDLGDDAGAADAIFVLGHSAAAEGDYARARELAEEAGRLWGGVGDERGVVWAKWLLAWACRGLGDDERADRLTTDVIEQARAVRDLTMLAMVLSGGRAHRAIEDGRIQDAVAMLKEAYEVNDEVQDHYRLTHIVSGLAHALAASRAPVAGAQVLASARAWFDESGGQIPTHLASSDEATFALLHEQLDDASFAAAWDQGRKLTLEAAVALAFAALV